jgi:hypothetical protein
MAELTSDYVRSVLDYDQHSGVFVWKVRRGSRAKAGDIAGSVSAKGYRYIRLDGKLRLEHRLAWLVQAGTVPSEYIDHLNGDRDDNRFSNLRPASPSQNLANARIPKNNTSGLKGVSFDRSRGVWEANISAKGKKKRLGRFRDKESAHEAYRRAAVEQYSEFARFK